MVQNANLSIWTLSQPDPQPAGRGKCRILREILDLSLGSMVNSRTGAPRCPSGSPAVQPVAPLLNWGYGWASD